MSQICSLETTIRMFWIDQRVKLKDYSVEGLNASGLEYVTLNPSAAEEFWIPDIFIDQAKVKRKQLVQKALN